MQSKTILALDMSTKTGWAVIEVENGDFTLVDCGTLTKESEPKGEYPINYLEWSRKCFTHIYDLFRLFDPDEIVVEETAKGSKNNMSQKIVEFVHYELALHLEDSKKHGKNYKPTYYLTEEWRRMCGCKMNNEEKKHPQNSCPFFMDTYCILLWH